MFKRFIGRETKRINDKIFIEKFEKQKVGNCPLCAEPVYANEGQIIKYLTIGEVQKPTHKKCRKPKREQKR